MIEKIEDVYRTGNLSLDMKFDIIVEKINEIVDYISSNELNRDKDKELLHSMVRDISKNRDDIEHLISQKLFNFNDRPE